MYCPKCGKENPEKQRYCNSCGLKLETISQTIAKDSGRGRDDRFVLMLRGNKGWQDPLIYAVVLIALGRLIGAIGYKVLDEKTLGDIGTLVALVGVLVILLKGIFLVIPTSSTTTTRSAKALDGESESQAPSALQARPVALLSAEPPSITEHTTNFLEPALEKADDERPRTTQPTLQ